MLSFKSQCNFILAEVTYANFLQVPSTVIRKVRREQSSLRERRTLLKIVKTRLFTEAKDQSKHAKDYIHDYDPLRIMLCASPRRTDLYSSLTGIVNKADAIHRRYRKNHPKSADSRPIFDHVTASAPIVYVAGFLIHYLRQKAAFKAAPSKLKHDVSDVDLDQSLDTFTETNHFADVVRGYSNCLKPRPGCFARKGVMTAMAMLNYLRVPCDPYTLSGMLRSPSEISDAQKRLRINARHTIL